MQRQAGVLMHISSLPGDYSVGTMGREAYRFIDFLEAGGFHLWQMLPFCLTDEFHSPYKSYSAFSLNPYFIDPEDLCERGLLTHDEVERAKQKSPYLCEFDRLDKERILLLKQASKRAFSDSVLQKEVADFLSAHPHTAEFAQFMAKKEANDGKIRTEWTVEHCSEESVFAWGFFQYIFTVQWEKLHAYAGEHGVSLIGDIPIYVSFDSSDVMLHPEQFLLDRDGQPAFVAGVPPDYFCPDGQKWGNPLYNWKKMKEDGYLWWTERIAHMLSLFDGIRIDHFRGFSSYFAIPSTAETAKTGKWMPGPGMDFVRVVRETAKGKLIIAEDLGLIDEKVNELVGKSGFPGMRVLQFALDGNPNNRHLPHTYPENCVAYTGTHDNNTLLGFYLEGSEENRQFLKEYCGCAKGGDDCADALFAMMRTMYESHADTVIFPIQDLLGYGGDTRMNKPGTGEDNWAYRVTIEQLKSIDWKKFRRLATLYGRNG